MSRVILCFVLLASCATPAERFSAVAENIGFTHSVVNTKQFQHHLFANALALKKKPASSLHVYIDGDGTPWKNKHWIADDPTSRNPIILQLMALDRSASLLLGRPCYHEVQATPACHFMYWTSHRYATEVVNSLASALTVWLKHHTVDKITLIGFSGGGTLAVLMAPLIEKATHIITIAANLDITAWSKFHGYSDLEHSLNPVEYPLNKQLTQLHLIGTSDTVVPEATLKIFLQRNPTAKTIRFEGFNHHCCWTEAWSGVINDNHHTQ
jgi:hypothetical protein